MHDPGAGTNLCSHPEVRYLAPGSAERALSKCTARSYQNLGGKYVVGTFLLLSEISSGSSFLL